ncbi:hypothetical protein BS50DRAFT_362827 [Corynespora cassiicola Philippines]|uniref:Uncharacterized protein n=1 Tax=Corynespora cassiicola Philippines TaxID=1448308 RepID=A0A2T2NSH7_CORCC|nr:hypothetical protein BS50DRAFT_362827 [Corynespora cassiicola Philippines]
MAFSQGIGERAALKSPREDSSFASLTSPLRGVGSQMGSSSSDARGQLHRRFTTNNIPTLQTPLSPIGQQRRQAAESVEFTTATYHKLQVVRNSTSLRLVFPRLSLYCLSLSLSLLHLSPLPRFAFTSHRPAAIVAASKGCPPFPGRGVPITSSSALSLPLFFPSLPTHVYQPPSASYSSQTFYTTRAVQHALRTPEAFIYLPYPSLYLSHISYISPLPLSQQRVCCVLRPSSTRHTCRLV